MATQFYKLNQKIAISAYFAVGSLEKGNDYKMINNLNQFYLALPKSSNFRSKLEMLDDENHVSMVASGINRGFKFLFGK